MLKRAIGRGCRAAPATKSTAQQPDQRTTSNVGTRRSGTTSPLRRLWARLQNVDLDLLRPDLFCLRELHFEHPVAEGRRHSPRLHWHWQLDCALELPVGALDVVGVVVLQLLAELALTSHREQIAGNRGRYVLLPDTRQLEVQEEIILRLVHVDNRHPNAAARSRRSGRRTTEEAVEQPVHLALDISEGTPRSMKVPSGRQRSIAMADPPCSLDIASLPAGLNSIDVSARAVALARAVARASRGL